jgi:hypothetical protein
MLVEVLESRRLLSSSISSSLSAQDLKPAAQSAAAFPLDKLPWNIRKIADGSRAAWSPDGRYIAFVDKQFGDGYEYDVVTGKRRIITDLAKNAGILRIQYLKSGDFLITAPATFKNSDVSRWNDAELWVMRRKHRSMMYRLGQKAYEGTAISRQSNRIAWVADQRQYAGLKPTLYTADIVYSPRGIPYLVHKKTEFSQSAAMEAQDFRDDDREIIFADYSGAQASVRGYNLVTHNTTTYRTSDSEYNEPEGIFPDGNFELIESSRDRGTEDHQSQRIDVWKLQLKPKSRNMVRLTRFGDLGPFKASNGVVSPDGKLVAFQQSTVGDVAGTGEALFLMQLSPDGEPTIHADTFNDSASKTTSWQVGGNGGSAKYDGDGQLVMSGGSNGKAVSTSLTRRFSTAGFSDILIRLDASQRAGAYTSSDSLRIEVDTGSGFERILTDAEQFGGVDNASADNLAGDDGNTAGASTEYLALPASADNGSIRVRIIATTTAASQAYLLGSFAVQGKKIS